MVNKTDNFSRDIDVMLNTCRNTKYICLELNTVKVHFKSLYEEQHRVGMLSDLFLSRYDVFKRDETHDGVEISKNLILSLVNNLNA